MDQTVETEAESISVLQQMASYSSSCAGGCTSSTVYINGKIIPGGCTWDVVSGAPELVSASGGSLVYNCQYKPKRTFSQSRVRKKTDSNCVVTTCSQSRIGFGYGSASSCLFSVAYPPPTPVVCPGSPSCLSLPIASCSSIARVGGQCGHLHALESDPAFDRFGSGRRCRVRGARGGIAVFFRDVIPLPAVALYGNEVHGKAGC